MLLRYVENNFQGNYDLSIGVENINAYGSLMRIDNDFQNAGIRMSNPLGHLSNYSGYGHIVHILSRCPYQLTSPRGGAYELAPYNNKFAEDGNYAGKLLKFKFNAAVGASFNNSGRQAFAGFTHPVLDGGQSANLKFGLFVNGELLPVTLEGVQHTASVTLEQNFSGTPDICFAFYIEGRAGSIFDYQYFNGVENDGPDEEKHIYLEDVQFSVEEPTGQITIPESTSSGKSSLISPDVVSFLEVEQTPVNGFYNTNNVEVCNDNTKNYFVVGNGSTYYNKVNYSGNGKSYPRMAYLEYSNPNFNAISNNEVWMQLDFYGLETEDDVSGEKISEDHYYVQIALNNSASSVQNYSRYQSAYTSNFSHLDNNYGIYNITPGTNYLNVYPLVEQSFQSGRQKLYFVMAINSNVRHRQVFGRGLIFCHNAQNRPYLHY